MVVSSVVDRLRSYGPGEIALYTFALTVLLAVVTNGPLASLEPLVATEETEPSVALDRLRGESDVSTGRETERE